MENNDNPTKEENIMRCPFCGYGESKVIDSRPTDENERIRRRRECLQCGKRFTTYEIIEDVPIIVVKKDKSREVFDRNKILKGMLRACEKRHVTIDDLEEKIGEIETALQSSVDREVTSARKIHCPTSQSPARDNSTKRITSSVGSVTWEGASRLLLS